LGHSLVKNSPSSCLGLHRLCSVAVCAAIITFLFAASRITRLISHDKVQQSRWSGCRISDSVRIRTPLFRHHSSRAFGDHKHMSFRFLVVSCFCLALVGCTTPEQYAAERRERLLAVYPPGTTTRADVQKKWARRQPDVSETRPASGWTASSQPFVFRRVATSEQRTGKQVYRCERYLGADGVSGGLCWCWFYYDDADHLLDTEWQWHTD
jgi:hypothetical protein